MSNRMSLEEATLRELQSQLHEVDTDVEIDDKVEGIADGILVITDPDITSEDYGEVIENAQELVDDTPEGEIPFNPDYIGEIAQTCPICGATFTDTELLEGGDTCPVCLEQPDAFVMVGKISEDSEMLDDEIDETAEEVETEEAVSNEEDVESEVSNESVQVAGNKLQETKDTECYEDEELDDDKLLQALTGKVNEKKEDKSPEAVLDNEGTTNVYHKTNPKATRKGKEVDRKVPNTKRVEESKLTEEEYSYDEIIRDMESAESYDELYDAASKIENDDVRVSVEEMIKDCKEDGDEVDLAYSVVITDLLDPLVNELNESKKLDKEMDYSFVLSLPDSQPLSFTDDWDVKSAKEEYMENGGANSKYTIKDIKVKRIEEESKLIESEDYEDAGKNRARLIDLCEEGVVSWESVARECIEYMSDDDVKDMAESSNFFVNDEDVEEELEFKLDESQETECDEFELEFKEESAGTASLISNKVFEDLSDMEKWIEDNNFDVLDYDLKASQITVIDKTQSDGVQEIYKYEELPDSTIKIVSKVN